MNILFVMSKWSYQYFCEFTKWSNFVGITGTEPEKENMWLLVPSLGGQ